MVDQDFSRPNQPIHFKAETQQLLNILIHSLYTEREVFLRELISNASDAITRINFEMLTNRDVLDPQAELAIWITADPENHTLTLRDTGIGMTAEELGENLGTIAHSGARAFLEASQKNDPNVKLSEIIGQFGVGFYSAFMVAETITVNSRSAHPGAEAASWVSDGSDTFTISTSQKQNRGTEVIIHLKEDAYEYAQETRLKEIIKKHSDYIPFPIYLGTQNEQINQQTALWRKLPREVSEEEYHEFYKQFTLDIDKPVAYAHMAVDAPVQMYAILFIPASPDRGMLSIRRQDGLKLYARKILIQEYCPELLPESLRFVQGIVDSEDLPLNVSRESVQSTRIIAQLKKLIVAKVFDTLSNLARTKLDEYTKFWKNFSRVIKEGAATDAENHDSYIPLLRYATLSDPSKLASLDEYIIGMKTGQKKIYYLVGEDSRSVINSPHLEIFRKAGLEVILMTEPIDSFVLLRLAKYKDFELANVAGESVDLPETSASPESASPDAAKVTAQPLVDQIKAVLADKVTDVRVSERLVESPARLVDPQGTSNPEFQRVYKMINKDYEIPPKILEINPAHPIFLHLAELPEGSELATTIIEQVFENALLIEGLHPDPASMIPRIQKLMQMAHPSSGPGIKPEA
jgi:HSP90 family molecular chaperone